MKEYKGPKIVPFDSRAILRLMGKRYVKQVSKPGVKAITFVIEREDSVVIQSSHRDDSETANILEKAASAMRRF